MTHRKKILLGGAVIIFLLVAIATLLSIGIDRALKSELLTNISFEIEKSSPPKTEIGHLFVVKRVVDGDTIVVSKDNAEITIRMIGINTPETVDPRKKVECFGKEASAKMKDLVEGKNVRLEEDPTQEAEDRYGRWLRYVFLEDGTNINLKMTEDGYAYEYTYHKPYQLQDGFKQAQQTASGQKRGLWSPDTCDGKK